MWSLVTLCSTGEGDSPLTPLAQCLALVQPHTPSPTSILVQCMKWELHQLALLDWVDTAVGVGSKLQLTTVSVQDIYNNIICTYRPFMNVVGARNICNRRAQLSIMENTWCNMLVVMSNFSRSLINHKAILCLTKTFTVKLLYNCNLFQSIILLCEMLYIATDNVLEAHCYVANIGWTDQNQICSRHPASVVIDSATYLLTIISPDSYWYLKP